MSTVDKQRIREMQQATTAIRMELCAAGFEVEQYWGLNEPYSHKFVYRKVDELDYEAKWTFLVEHIPQGLTGEEYFAIGKRFAKSLVENYEKHKQPAEQISVRLAPMSPKAAAQLLLSFIVAFLVSALIFVIGCTAGEGRVRREAVKEGSAQWSKGLDGSVKFEWKVGD